MHVERKDSNVGRDEFCNVFFLDEKESLEGEKGKNMHVGIERNNFREGK